MNFSIVGSNQKYTFSELAAYEEQLVSAADIFLEQQKIVNRILINAINENQISTESAYVSLKYLCCFYGLVVTENPRKVFQDLADMLNKLIQAM